MEIVPVQVGTELRVDSREMAERLGNQHASAMKLITKNLEHFERFGRVGFEIATLETRGGKQETRYTLLNEDQCYFLLTLVRNSETVVKLKAALVLAFREARKRLMLDMNDPLAVAQAFVVAETERRTLAAQVQEDAPKVEAYRVLMDSSALYSIQHAAKLLNIGEITLFRMLRAEGVLMDKDKAGKEMHNVPYRQYEEAGYFQVKARPFTLPDGTERAGSTTYVTSKGLDFLRRFLDRTPKPLQLPMIGAAVPA